MEEDKGDNISLVMFRCFQCEYVSSSMEEVKKHIKSKHDVKPSDDSKTLSLMSSLQDSEPCQDATISDQSVLRWTHEMVKCLIECFKKHEDKFNDFSVSKKHVWRIIAKDIAEVCSLPYPLSGDLCNEKWRSLLRTYRRTKNNLKKPGYPGLRFRFQFFDQMDEIFSKRPEYIASMKSLSRSEIGEDSSADEEESSFLASAKKKKKLAIPHCCAQLMNKIEKFEIAKENAAQRRHDEQMGLLRELIKIKREKMNMLQNLS